LDFNAFARIVGSSIDIGAIEFAEILQEPSPTVPVITEPLPTALPSTKPSPTVPVITEPLPTALPSTKPSPTTPPTTDHAPFVIDGMERDWQDYSALATSSSNVKA